MSGDFDNDFTAAPVAKHEAAKPQTTLYDAEKKRQKLRRKVLWGVFFFLLFILFCILTWH